MLCKLVKKDYFVSNPRGYRSMWVDSTACNAKGDIIDGEVGIKHDGRSKAEYLLLRTEMREEVE